MDNLTCILCPRGCHLKVDPDHDYQVTGNACPRGAKYGKEELLNPVRVVTSTVRTKSKLHPRCSVKTDRPIAKADLFKAMELLDDIELDLPISCGQLVLEGILGGQANFVATRSIEA